MKRLITILTLMTCAVFVFAGHSMACDDGDIYFCYEDNSVTNVSNINKTKVPPELPKVPLGETPRGTGGERNILPSPQVYEVDGVKVRVIPAEFCPRQYVGDNYHNICLPEGVLPVALIQQSMATEERKEGLIISGEDPQDAISKTVRKTVERFPDKKEIVILMEVTYDSGTVGKTFVLPGAVTGGTNPTGIAGAGIGKWVAHEEKAVVLTATYYEALTDEPIPCIRKAAPAPTFQTEPPVVEQPAAPMPRPCLCTNMFDVQKSIESLEKRLGDCKENKARLHEKLGFAYLCKSRLVSDLDDKVYFLNEARKQFEEALKKDPSSSKARSGLREVWILLDRKDVSDKYK
jgi:hypothetical protein